MRRVCRRNPESRFLIQTKSLERLTRQHGPTNTSAMQLCACSWVLSISCPTHGLADLLATGQVGCNDVSTYAIVNPS